MERLARPFSLSPRSLCCDATRTSPEFARHEEVLSSAGLGFSISPGSLRTKGLPPPAPLQPPAGDPAGKASGAALAEGQRENVTHHKPLPVSGGEEACLFLLFAPRTVPSEEVESCLQCIRESLKPGAELRGWQGRLLAGGGDGVWRQPQSGRCDPLEAGTRWWQLRHSGRGFTEEGA